MSSPGAIDFAAAPELAAGGACGAGAADVPVFAAINAGPEVMRDFRAIDGSALKRCALYRIHRAEFAPGGSGARPPSS